MHMAQHKIARRGNLVSVCFNIKYLNFTHHQNSTRELLQFIYIFVIFHMNTF